MKKIRETDGYHNDEPIFCPLKDAIVLTTIMDCVLSVTRWKTAMILLLCLIVGKNGKHFKCFSNFILENVNYIQRSLKFTQY